MKKQNVLDFRQGDVGFVRGAIPTDAKRIATRPFAYGEVTGHVHQVVEEAQHLVEMYEDSEGTVWVRALGDLPVRHEEHDPTAQKSIIPKGWEGRVQICGEYDEEEDFRSVID